MNLTATPQNNYFTWIYGLAIESLVNPYEEIKGELVENDFTENKKRNVDICFICNTPIYSCHLHVAQNYRRRVCNLSLHI